MAAYLRIAYGKRLAVVYFYELDLCLALVDGNRVEGSLLLSAQGVAYTLVRVGQSVDVDMGLFAVLRGEMGKALNVVPVGVADEQVDLSLVAFDEFSTE